MKHARHRGPIQGLPLAREDAYPSYDMHPDTGCDLHPSCLTCPFEKCRYDEPGGVPAIQRPSRDAAIVAASTVERMNTAEIAARFGLNRRTVYRILKESKHD